MAVSIACGTQPAGSVADGVAGGATEADGSAVAAVVDGVGLTVLSTPMALAVALADGETEDDTAAVGRIP
jgi:hypothetical protein